MSIVKILVVEDVGIKAMDIRNCILSLPELSEQDIEICPDQVSSRRALMENVYDLVILDLMIPRRFDQQPKPDGGVEFLKIINDNDKYCKPHHIIGLTAYDDVFKQYHEYFDDELWSIIKYEEHDGRWCELLRKKIQYILDTKKHSGSLDADRFGIDFGIICALPSVEYNALQALDYDWSEYKVKNDSTVYRSGRYKGSSIMAAYCPQMGMVSATTLSLKMIYEFFPKRIGIIGICAGVENRTNVGDAIIADQVWDYNFGKKVVKNKQTIFQPDPKYLSLSAELKDIFMEISRCEVDLAKIRQSWLGLKPEFAIRSHVGPMATGASVIADAETMSAIIKYNRNLLGIDMESYGVFYAAHNCKSPRPLPFSIKSVCDYGDNKKDDTYQPYSAHVSASLLDVLIRKCQV